MTLKGTKSNHSRKAVLRAKLPAILRKFVEKLKFEDELWFYNEADRTDLINTVAELHAGHLTSEDVMHLLQHERIRFVLDCEFEVGALGDQRNQTLCEQFYKALWDHIESLPRQYTVRIELAKFEFEKPHRFAICDDISFVTGNPIPARDKGARRLETTSRQLLHDAVTAYFEYRVSGYGCAHATSPATSAAISKAKQINFILKSTGVLSVFPLRDSLRVALTTELTDETVQISLPHATRQGLEATRPNMPMFLTTELATVISPQGPLDGILSTTAIMRRMASTHEEEIEAISANLHPIRQFYECREHPDHVAICAAIEWYEDSLSAENQTFAYLAACIGLEAVLGSDDTMPGMTNRLADRYSFMLGTGRTERASLSAGYMQILKVRGNLVHAKAARLSPEESTFLAKARSMLKRVIEHEIGAMTANHAKLAGTALKN